MKAGEDFNRGRNEKNGKASFELFFLDKYIVG